MGRSSPFVVVVAVIVVVFVVVVAVNSVQLLNGRCADQSTVYWGEEGGGGIVLTSV